MSVPRKTLLGYELTLYQDALVNYFIPSLGACALFIAILACDVGVIFRQFKDEQPIWASLTILFIWAPSIGSYIVIISDWDLWPDAEGFGFDNVAWALLKTLEHIFSPIWQLWRFGERLFWSIDALLCEDDMDRAESMEHVYEPRNIELSVFLQAYLHALPQILLQLYILMRHEKNINKATEDIQIASIVFNLLKLSITTTNFQRFKTQKLAGKHYPWFKHRKKIASAAPSSVELRREVGILRTESNYQEISRRSSAYYLQPIAITDPLNVTVNPDPEFDIRRTVAIKGMTDDDMAGKLVATVWWFNFLLARLLTITTFQYFFPHETLYILISHYILVIAFLLYDVKSDAINRGKALFFVFIGFIYIFCIIEFKIKFKKATFIYYGFFFLVFGENLVMCLIWFNEKLDGIQNDFWFRFIFIMVVMCSISSFTSMLFYMNINKPRKVVVTTRLSATNKL